MFTTLDHYYHQYPNPTTPTTVLARLFKNKISVHFKIRGANKGTNKKGGTEDGARTIRCTNCKLPTAGQ